MSDLYILSRLERRASALFGGLVFTTLALSSVSAQTLTYVQGSDFHVLDPAVSGSTPSHILFRHVFNGLVTWANPEDPEIVPDLATAWTTSEDGLQWTFTLRDDVTFHDGTPFNAEAVKFNLDRLLAEGTGSPVRSLFAPVSGVEVVDATTVNVNLSRPLPTLLELLADEYGSISSPAAIEQYGESYAVNPVGTGPYIFREWAPNEFARIERNPGYFGTPGIPQEIVFRPVPENAARVIEIETGAADIAGTIPPEAAPQIEARDDVALVVAPSSFQIFFEFNTTAEPFEDIRMREAASLAIDREAIITHILGGYGSLPRSPFPEGVQGRVEFEPHVYDPERARELIEEVYPGGYDGTVVIWTPVGRYMNDRAVAEAVQAYLNAVGLNTEFRAWEWAAYQRALYEVQEGGTGRGTNAANLWLLGTGITNADRRLRGKLVEGDPSNLTGYNNEQVQELLAAAAVELDYSRRMAIYGEVQDIVWNEDPNGLPLFDQVQILAVREGVSQPEIYSDEIILFGKVSK
jgi:ABC-type transport system substrate-binding protein